MSGMGPGWYDDGTGGQRWWNGVSWSEATRPSQQAQQQAQQLAAWQAQQQAANQAQYAASQAQQGGGPASVILPGWYDDGSGAQRWWDGVAWTEHTRTGHVADAPPYAAGAGHPAGGGYTGVATPPPRRPRTLVAVLVAAAVIVILFVGGVIAVRVASASQSSPANTVRAYDAAWHDVDCDDFEQATTDGFRSRYYPDCDAFEMAADGLAPGYRVDVITSDMRSDRATVSTVEGWPDENTWNMEYSLVREGSSWRIMDIVESR